MPTVAIDKLVRAMFIDPAGGKQKIKRTAANQAIVVVGALARFLFVLEAWRGRLPTDRFHEKILDVARIFTPHKIGCEANAMQFLFAEDIRLVARLKGIRLAVEPIYQPTGIEKPVRIRLGLQPIINTGRLFIDKQKHPEMVEEVTQHPHGRTVDLVDALESACRMLPQGSPEEQAQDTEATLKSYLARLGKNDDMIERRLAEWRSQRGRPEPPGMLSNQRPEGLAFT